MRRSVTGMLILALTGSVSELPVWAVCIIHTFADTFSDIAQSDEDYKMEVKTTAGSAANLRLLSENYVQLAIAQADLTNDAYYGTGIFEEKEYQGYSAIAGLYTEAC